MDKQLKLEVNVSRIINHGNGGGVEVNINEKKPEKDILCAMKLFFKENDVDFDFGLYELTLKKI